jgi:hypothetical protein
VEDKTNIKKRKSKNACQVAMLDGLVAIHIKGI